MIPQLSASPYPEGIARLLELVAQRMPRAEVEAVWAFPGVRREGREYGVAVVSRAGEGDRRRVYRARYVLQLKGQDRGKAILELEETAETPAELLPTVIEGVGRRADEAGEAELLDLGAWKAGDGDERRTD
jgi:pyruvate/2-oxoglutarate dehydrogenase complex dihydrolipoamide acyltransferase (E2) component